jgi:hypothetical protein
VQKASSRMIGIGTPKTSSSSERMASELLKSGPVVPAGS